MLTALKTMLEAAVGLCGIAIAMVAGVAFIEWLMPDADILGHDIPIVEVCRQCDRPAHRCGLCENHYFQAISTAARRRGCIHHG